MMLHYEKSCHFPYLVYSGTQSLTEIHFPSTENTTIEQDQNDAHEFDCSTNHDKLT